MSSISLYSPFGKKKTPSGGVFQKRLSNLVNRLLKYLPRFTEKKDEMAKRSQKQVKSCEQADARAAFFFSVASN